MSVLVGLATALMVQLYCAWHVLRTGRRYHWIVPIMVLPVIGCAVYYLLAVFPSKRIEAARHRAGELLKPVDEGARKGIAPGGRYAGRHLRIVFADRALAYTASSPYQQPLGGSQSAACYLSEALALAGHEIILITNTQAAGRYRGVSCAGWEHLSAPLLRESRPDVVVSLMAADQGEALRGIFGDAPRLIFWTGHAHDQPSVQPLQDAVAQHAYDGFAFVSNWQMQRFLDAFELEASRSRVLGNALAPAFRNLFGAGDEVSRAKARPPMLAYTSTPFRGLSVLLDQFPQIRRRVPGTRLKVFSDMSVYQMDRTQDKATYGDLYRRCRDTEGVQYVGALPQPRLARELLDVSTLSYPNIFPETYCIAALEAMAAGCRVVSSELGALPETTAGFARLVPIIGRTATFGQDFVEAMVTTLNESLAGADADLLGAQVAYVNAHCTWERRAREWLEWLQDLPRR